MLAYVIPMSGDEAYFIIWAKHLDFGYYDHPPMVGWFLHLMLYLGSSEVILRLPGHTLLRRGRGSSLGTYPSLLKSSGKRLLFYPGFSLGTDKRMETLLHHISDSHQVNILEPGLAGLRRKSLAYRLR